MNKNTKKLAYTIAGAALFCLGVACTIGPGPGLIMMAAGGGMVLNNSEKAQKLFRKAREKSGWFDRRVTWMENKIPWMQEKLHNLYSRIPVVKNWKSIKKMFHNALERFLEGLHKTKPKCEELADKAKEKLHDLTDKVQDIKDAPDDPPQPPAKPFMDQSSLIRLRSDHRDAAGQIKEQPQDNSGLQGLFTDQAIPAAKAERPNTDIPQISAPQHDDATDNSHHFRL